jgi:hypothetical protein
MNHVGYGGRAIPPGADAIEHMVSPRGANSVELPNMGLNTPACKKPRHSGPEALGPL